ncbi:MAG: HEPN domain-containing protein [Magnetococcales bacterium]|nr:HEPN domain-containing protein [Magnetococcales bacterium]
MLLLLARKDLKVSRILAGDLEPEAEAIGFHLQQATEKALKAWLAYRGVRADTRCGHVSACPRIPPRPVKKKLARSKTCIFHAGLQTLLE